MFFPLPLRLEISAATLATSEEYSTRVQALKRFRDSCSKFDHFFESALPNGGPESARSSLPSAPCLVSSISGRFAVSE